jgi:cytochrome c6
MMKKITVRMFAIVAALAVVSLLPVSAGAQDEALYKSKCAGCHGADGKKAAGHDLSSADVQKESDADLAGVITNGKPPKMPKYASLTPDQVKGLVAYIRTLKK